MNKTSKINKILTYGLILAGTIGLSRLVQSSINDSFIGIEKKLARYYR